METETKTEKSILDEISILTEPKKPGAKQIKTWQMDEAEEMPIETETVGGNDPKVNPTTTAPPANEIPNKSKLTDQAIKGSATSSTAFVELITINLSQAVIYLKHHFKLSAEERDLLDTKLLDKSPNDLTDQERVLVNRAKRLLAERNMKLEKISPDKEARKRMEQAFEDYTRLTGQTFVTPKMNLIASVSEAVIKSVIAAAVM